MKIQTFGYRELLLHYFTCLNYNDLKSQNLKYYNNYSYICIVKNLVLPDSTNQQTGEVSCAVNVVLDRVEKDFRKQRPFKLNIRQMTYHLRNKRDCWYKNLTFVTKVF
jgi:hypothetical protein